MRGTHLPAPHRALAARMLWPTIGVRTAGLLAMTIGAWALASWSLGAGHLTSLVAGFHRVNPLAALCLTALGLALVMPRSARFARLAWCRVGIGGGVAGLGMLVALSAACRQDWPVDRLLLPAAVTSSDSLMPANAALAFAFCGLGLVLLASRSRRFVLVGQLCALATLLVTLAAAIAYLYHAIRTQDDKIVGWMAVPALVGLTAIALGLLFLRPRRGIMGVVTSADIGGAMIRYALPAIVVSTIGLSALHMIVLQEKLVSGSTASALHPVATILIEALIVLIIAERLNRSSRKSREREQALVASEARLRLLADGIANHAFYVLDPTGRLQTWNIGATRLYGYEAEDVQGQPFSLFFPKATAEIESKRLLAEAEATGRFNGEGWRVRRDGTSFWAGISIRAMRDHNGVLVGFGNIVQDLTEQRRQEEEHRRLIESARDAADAANRAKSAFLASMSHEIRTPLNGVLGLADLLADSTLDPTQRDYVARLRESGRSLLAIISDVLDISKIEAGKLEIEHVPMSLAAIIASAAEIMAGQIAAKELMLRTELAPDLPDWIAGDPTRTRQILLNYLGNAVKFTGNGTITIRAGRSAGGLVRIEVADTGIGIAPDRQPMLFQDFSQVDQSTTRRFGGTGLGLSICRRLAGAMGGETGVTSALGAGSTFWFTLPVVACAAPLGSDASSNEAAAARPADILIAEDVEMNRFIVSAMLRPAGHRLTLVTNGREAVEAMARGRYDLVLMDMEMPEMDGIEATRTIRRLGAPKGNVPIVALTANAMIDALAHCKEAGMNDYLSKPLNRDQLLAMVAAQTSAAEPPQATAPAPGARAELDPAVLAELEAMIGADRVAELSQLAIERMTATVAALGRPGDPLDQAREVHNVVAAAGQFGCLALMDDARALERALRAAAPEAELLSRRFAPAVDRAVAALRRHYPLAAPPESALPARAARL